MDAVIYFVGLLACLHEILDQRLGEPSFHDVHAPPLLYMAVSTLYFIINEPRRCHCKSRRCQCHGRLRCCVSSPTQVAVVSSMEELDDRLRAPNITRQAPLRIHASWGGIHMRTTPANKFSRCTFVLSRGAV